MGTSKIRIWDEINVNEQFNIVEYANIRYYTNSIETTANLIEKQLENRTLSGHDDVKPELEHTKEATIYKIKGINTKCAIAIQFENKGNYYIYVNQDYVPKTLGELVNDLNLQENVQFGLATYFEKINNNYMSFEFKGIPKDIIWKMLFSTTSANGKFGGVSGLSIKVTSDLFGDENAYCIIRENGYLSVHIDYFKEWYFYIGEERTKEFLNYVFDNYEAEATVYVHDEEEKTDGPETIMVMENIL